MAIYNENQYRITREWIGRFERDLRIFKESPDRNDSPLLFKAIRDSYEGQLETLKAEVEEYKQWRDTCVCGGDIVDYDDVSAATMWRICESCGGATTPSGKYLPKDSGFNIPPLISLGHRE